MLRYVQIAYAIAYVASAILFGVCALVLVFFGVHELWLAVSPNTDADFRARFDHVLESVGLATIAVASLELSQTVMEEEVQRSSAISAPTRVRRFLSRFLIVVVVSLAIECLVGVFGLLHSDPTKLPHAASIGVAAAALLTAWGLFVRWNEAAERLEPEALARAKREDIRVDAESGTQEESPEQSLHATERQRK